VTFDGNSTFPYIDLTPRPGIHVGHRGDIAQGEAKLDAD
jgi:hypothetical protein